MMRTHEEIAQRVAELREEGGTVLFDFRISILVSYLPFKWAKPFLKPEITEEEWNKIPPPSLDRESVLKEMETYMAEYGWDKALNHRGLSAIRTVQKMEAWLWLLGDADDLIAFCREKGNYENYGAPILKAICERYNFPIPDDPAAHRMAAGQPCRDECNEGCGKE